MEEDNLKHKFLLANTNTLCLAYWGNEIHRNMYYYLRNMERGRIEHKFLDLNLIYILQDLNYNLIYIIYPFNLQRCLMGRTRRKAVLLDQQNNHLDKEMCKYYLLDLPKGVMCNQYILYYHQYIHKYVLFKVYMLLALEFDIKRHISYYLFYNSEV